MNDVLEAAPMGTGEIQVLRSAMLFSLTRHTWSNRRKADKAKIQTTADKKKLNLTKQLIESKELDALNSHLNRIYEWCLGRSMASTAVRRGIYFVKRSMVSEFEENLEAAVVALRKKYVPEFLAVYDDQREAMREPTKLGDLFCEGDYPSKETLRGMFSIEWSWLALSVPNELPEEVREREVTKLRESFEQAQTDIKYALRTGFKEMVAHAVERLTVKPGEKPKMFKDTLVTNFNQFFETFNARNLMDDTELARLVHAARNVVAGLPENVDAIRGSTEIRTEAARSFAELNEALGELVIDVPSRRFDMEA